MMWTRLHRARRRMMKTSPNLLLQVDFAVPKDFFIFFLCSFKHSMYSTILSARKDKIPSFPNFVYVFLFFFQFTRSRKCNSFSWQMAQHARMGNPIPRIESREEDWRRIIWFVKLWRIFMQISYHIHIIFIVFFFVFFFFIRNKPKTQFFSFATNPQA